TWIVGAGSGRAGPALLQPMTATAACRETTVAIARFMRGSCRGRGKGVTRPRTGATSSQTTRNTETGYGFTAASPRSAAALRVRHLPRIGQPAAGGAAGDGRRRAGGEHRQPRAARAGHVRDVQLAGQPGDAAGRP